MSRSSSNMGCTYRNEQHRPPLATGCVDANGSLPRSTHEAHKWEYYD
ncbi:hypothetical protein PBI_LORDE_46 [Mycobacterium phage Lorde]|nr:hypothetical protein PBI_ENBY_46 [Mycobacterium phage Enby]QGJ91233.1 hypothetical protein PBI_LORDE_46 [Mycobacterium phage Lorde]